ncbi:MAG: helix-turn-helix domain-containing protein [Nitrospira sp. CG24E]|nr:MAG: helix-turn-helix domain-containing protein [Nitrospira sp. CG24E]
MQIQTRQTPRKQKGQGLGPRTVNGALLDVHGAAVFLGTTEKTLRGQVARRLIPFRRCGGRIYFVRSELEGWLAALPGCTLDEAKQNGAQRYDGVLR